MEDLWRRLEDHLARHAPAVLDFLNPPATAAAIRRAEAALGLSLPTDLAASLRIHNGQPQISRRPPYPIALVPAERAGRRGDTIATWGQLAPLDLIVWSTQKEWRMMSGVSAETAARFRYQGPVRQDGDWSWISFVDPGSGNRLGLDLNPAPRGQVGQVLSIVHDPPCLFVLAPSYRAWFERLVERYESGRYVIAEEDGYLTAQDKRRRARAAPGTSRRDDTRGK